MQSIWKGSVTFGLVNVPVKVYSATESHDVSFHQVHDADHGRIRYRRVCEIDGEVVPNEHIVRAHTQGKNTVVVTKADFANLPAEREREIEILEFVPSDQIDPVMLASSYYLEPDAKAAKAYLLLRRTLEATNRTAVAKFALRERTRLAVLRVRGNMLMLQTLLWADEVREPVFPALSEDVSISDKELAMAEQLVTSFESDFRPQDFHDEYQIQLRELIDAKIAKGEAFTATQEFGKPGAVEAGAQVVDLMEALRKSVAEAKAKTASKAAPAKKPAVRRKAS